MIMRKILFIGSPPPPYHGQAIVTQIVFETKFKGIDPIFYTARFSKELSDVGGFSLMKLWVLMKCWWMLHCLKSMVQKTGSMRSTGAALKALQLASPTLSHLRSGSNHSGSNAGFEYVGLDCGLHC